MLLEAHSASRLALSWLRFAKSQKSVTRAHKTMPDAPPDLHLKCKFCAHLNQTRSRRAHHLTERHAADVAVHRVRSKELRVVVATEYEWFRSCAEWGKLVVLAVGSCKACFK